MDSTRLTLAVMTGAVLVVAAVTWTLDQRINAGVALRVAVLLGALWLAWPNLVSVPRRTWSVVALSILVLVARPRAALFVIPIILIVASLRRRD